MLKKFERQNDLSYKMSDLLILVFPGLETRFLPKDQTTFCIKFC